MDVKRIMTEATAGLQAYVAKHKGKGAAEAESHLAKLKAVIKEADRAIRSARRNDAKGHS